MNKHATLLGAILLGLASVMSDAQAPVPFISLPLVPDATAPGGGDFTLTVNGTGFVSNSVVNWDGNPLPTQFVSGSRLTATVPATDIATTSTGWVTVTNPPTGGGTSNLAFFSVTPDPGNSVMFTLASSATVGNGALTVVTGDFNGDKKLDLAVTNASDNTVSILLGKGDGTFTAANLLTVGTLPYSVAVGDFNADGKLDLAVTNTWDNTVSVLLGDGAGNFTGASVVATGIGPISLASADLNGDGKLDLAVANYDGCTVSILLGDGTGNFSLISSAPTDVQPMYVAVGDFNADGKLDLAVTNDPADTVSIMLGDGTGTYTLASSPFVSDFPIGVAVADLNGDGKLDLVTSNGASGTLSVLLGDNGGNFTNSSTPSVNGYPMSAAVGDLNADGKPDLAVSNPNGNILSVLLGDGTGNFTLALSPPAGLDVYFVIAGDFNNDGKLDLAVNNYWAGTISVLLQGLYPAATLSPPVIDFGTQLLATRSTPQTVTLTNTGSATLEITDIAASANFIEQNHCGNSLDAGASCSIRIAFNPHVIGAVTGMVTITDNAISSPQMVTLTGTSTAVTLLPSSLDFGDQPVGTVSQPQMATLTNYGKRALSISRIGIGGQNRGAFSQTNNCGTSLPAQGSCTISVTFSPQHAGTKSATLGVADNGGASPQTLALSGNGT